MYIVFMALLALSFHWYFIDRLQKKKQRELTLIKYVSLIVKRNSTTNDLLISQQNLFDSLNND
jgi:hypothetical protein